MALDAKAESGGALQLSVNTSTLDIVDDLRPLEPTVTAFFPAAPCPIAHGLSSFPAHPPLLLNGERTQVLAPIWVGPPKPCSPHDMYPHVLCGLSSVTTHN